MRNNIAVLMMRRKYAKQRIDLPDKFWNLPKYKKEFQHQLRCASKLIRSFDDQAILNTLEKNQWIYSLGFQGLHDLIADEELSIERSKHNSQCQQASKNDQKVTFRKKNKSSFKDG